MRARRSPIRESIGEELSKFINCYNKDVFIHIFYQMAHLLYEGIEEKRMGLLLD